MIFKARHLLLIYSTITIVFVSVVFLKQRGYQDTWILQDVFVPTMIYIFTSLAVAVLANDNRVVALVCASFLVVLNAIPNLKYQLFYGTFDSVGHYGYVKDLLSLGFVPQTGFYASSYSDFPGMHIFIGSLSLVSGVLLGESIKIVTSAIFGTIPLMTYLVANRIFEKSICKYIVIASIFSPAVSYALAGSVFALPLYFSFFCVLFRRNLLNENRKQLTLVLMIFGFSLLISHAVTILALVSLMAMMVLLLKCVDFIKKYFRHSLSSMYLGTLFFLVLIFSAWLMFKAGSMFEKFVEAVQRIFFSEIIVGPVPVRFYEVPFWAQLRFVAIGHLSDAIITGLTFAGLFVLLKKFKRKNKCVFVNLYLPLLCLLSGTSLVLTFQLVTGFGELGYGRLMNYAMVFSPFFVGLLLWHLNERISTTFRKMRFERFALFLLLFSCISLSLIQIFPYQPLVPGANVLSKDLPADEYIFDFRSVNTIYQEKMISFAERFSSGDASIASDRVTRWQIRGLANESFSRRLVSYSPLEPNMNIENKGWDIFLLHYGSRSGPLNEKVEYRTREKLENLRDTLGNVVYDNGESFIIAR